MFVSAFQFTFCRMFYHRTERLFERSLTVVQGFVGKEVVMMGLALVAWCIIVAMVGEAGYLTHRWVVTDNREQSNSHDTS